MGDVSNAQLNKISINLLPHEVLLERVQSHKTNFVNKISIGILIIVIAVTAVVAIFRIIQNNEVARVNNQVAVAEKNLMAEKSKEEAVAALKSRLTSIQGLLGSDEKIKAMFNLILFLTPPEITMSDVTVDKNGTVTASFSSTSLASIDRFFADLGNKEKNSGLVSRVDLDGISLGKESAYRFALKIFNTDAGKKL